MRHDHDAQGARVADGDEILTLTAGVGLKPEHFDAALDATVPGLWFEVHAENHAFDGGPRARWLEAIRDRHPVSLHGVSLSLGGAEPLDPTALAQLRALVSRIEPALVSEHLAWSRHEGAWFPDLLPVVRDDASLAALVSRIDQVQEAIGRPIAVENPSHYLRIDGHTWPEIDFLAEIAHRSGCALLLDLNNVHVSANNLGFDAVAYVDAFPECRVAEIHIAGHRPDPVHGQALLIDSHDAPVDAAVWALLDRFVARAGPRPTLVERDAELPSFAELIAERDVAHRRLVAAPEAVAA